MPRRRKLFDDQEAAGIRVRYNPNPTPVDDSMLNLHRDCRQHGHQFIEVHWCGNTTRCYEICFGCGNLWEEGAADGSLRGELSYEGSHRGNSIFRENARPTQRSVNRWGFDSLNSAWNFVLRESNYRVNRSAAAA